MVAFADFEFTTPAPGTAAAAQVALLHVAAEHPEIMPAARTARDSRKPPPLERPTVELGCSPSQWAIFILRWERFKIGSNIPSAQQALQAMECFSKELGDTADKSIFNINSLGSSKKSRPSQYSLLQQSFGKQRRTPPTSNNGRVFKHLRPAPAALSSTASTYSRVPTRRSTHYQGLQRCELLLGSGQGRPA